MKMREMELELLVILDLMPPVPTPCTPRALFWPVHLGLGVYGWPLLEPRQSNLERKAFGKNSHLIQVQTHFRKQS